MILLKTKEYRKEFKVIQILFYLPILNLEEPINFIKLFLTTLIWVFSVYKSSIFRFTLCSYDKKLDFQWGNRIFCLELFHDMCRF